eukprot:4584376-Pyramimonas_sp.AAC.1
MFCDAMVKVGKIKAEHAARVQRLARKRGRTEPLAEATEVEGASSADARGAPERQPGGETGKSTWAAAAAKGGSPAASSEKTKGGASGEDIRSRAARALGGEAQGQSQP